MLKLLLRPSFLIKFDQYLLLNHPLVWSSKIHFVAWYTLFGWIAMILLGFMVPNESLDNDFLAFYWLLAILCMVAGIIIWLFFVLRHNSTKQYGNRVIGREWVNMLCHYLSLLLITSVIFVMPFIKIVTSHIRIQSNHIVEKVNVLNVNNAFFPENEYELQQLYMPLDSLQQTVVSFKLGHSDNKYGEDSYHTLDSNFLTYDQIGPAFYEIHGKDSIRHAIENYLSVIHSMGLEHPYSVSKITALIDDTLAYKRDLTFETINASMNGAIHFKLRPYFRAISKFDFLLEKAFYTIWLMLILPIALLALTVFRNTSLKFYLISIGVTIVLVIINSIFIGLFFSDYDNKGNNLIVLGGLFIGWTIVLSIFSSRVHFLKRYQVINAYSVFLFNLLLPVLPFVFTALVFGYFEHMNYMYRCTFPPYHEVVDFPYPKLDYQTVENWYWWMACLGLFLLIVLQQLFFKPLYERLWALPK